MFSKTGLGFLAFVLLSTSEQVLGRERWLERDNKPVFLYPRRFGQEQPEVLQKLRAACPGQVCGNLAGQAVTPLLAAQPECSQQDMADAIIDASRQFDAATQANMIAIAQEYRQAEKNTPPDFTTNPPTARNSVFCQKAPKNAELNGLVQAQDPANDPNLFFDPATKSTVRKGTQANTAPFGGVAAPALAAPATAASAAESSSAPAATTNTAVATALPAEQPAQTDCVTAITVTVTGSNPAATNPNAVTVTVGNGAATTAAPATPTGVDFGSCTVPEIEFGVGFDNRKESSFQPKDKASFNHDSAQNVNIITQFICDTLTNKCNANQAAKDLCATAQAQTAAATPAKTGIQADVFNGVFGITTKFADLVAFDNQGNPVPGTGAGSTGSEAATPSATAIPATSTTPVSTTAAATTLSSAPTATSAGNTGNAPTSGNTGSTTVGNFGKCTTPQIQFAAGLEGRKETSFIPTDLTSFNHGSAQNIGIITRFICDTLTNSCGADQTAKATCTKATAAAAAAAAGTGAQADAFNAAFNINTNFASVTPIDNQGRLVTTGQVPVDATPASTTPVNNQSAGGSTPGNLQTFTGALGGVVAPTVTASGNGQFQVEGNASFNNQRNAIVRSCDVQNNKCANAANSSGNRNGLTVSACNAQQAQCIANAGN